MHCALPMDFKKIASGAGTLFSRAKQYTEEKLGHAERTEYDAQLDNLLQRGDKTKKWTEQIVQQTEAVLQPNPTARMEEFLYEKVQGKKPVRLVEADVLGQHLIDAGNDLSSNTAYSSSLVRVGQTEQKVGQAQREFIRTASNDFLQPLAIFLDGDMKNIQRERKILETRRLDLDAAKSRLKRAKSQPAKDSDGDVVGRAESEVRSAQTEYDRQCEVTRLLLEGLSGSYAHHQRCLHDFVDAQATYYAQCNQYMSDLRRQLGIIGSLSNNDISARNNNTTTSNLSNVFDSRNSTPSGTGGDSVRYIPAGPGGDSLRYTPAGTVVDSRSYTPAGFESNVGSVGCGLDAEGVGGVREAGVGLGSQRGERKGYDYDGGDMTELSLSANDEDMNVFGK